MILVGWVLDAGMAYNAVRHRTGDKPVVGMPEVWNPLDRDAW
jgi:hypothetical protein